jgi:hypothetical protein
VRPTSLVLTLCCLLFCAPAYAQSTNCTDGVRHDDNSFETGAGWLFGKGEYVMRVDSPGHLEAVCLCWQRGGGDSSVFFNLNVWSASGPNGGPGQLLGRLSTLQAQGVGTVPTWFRYDISSLNINSPGGVYIGPEWNSSDDEDFFVCTDSSPSTPQQPGYGQNSIFDDPPISKLGQVGFFPEYRALGVRAKFGAVTSLCSPTASRLCLGQGRFAVTATFQAGADPQGTASVVKLTEETGYLWFFNSANVEAVVKVLDACALNGKYWVFAGGLTNVQVDLTVTDTETGNSKTYRNPQGSAFLPIQDTAALPCN